MRNREKEGKGDTQMKTVLSTKQCKQKIFTLFLDSPPKRKGGESPVSHYGLAVAMESAKSQAFEVSCWASVN